MMRTTTPLNVIQTDNGSKQRQQQARKKSPPVLKTFLKQCVLIFLIVPLLGLFNSIQAQCPTPGDACSVVTAPAGPYVFQLNGSAGTLGNGTLSSLIIPADPECGYGGVPPYDYLVFPGGAAPLDGATENPADRVFDCASIGLGTQTLWVVLEDDNQPKGVYNVDCDALIQLQVTPVDNHSPDLVCPDDIGDITPLSTDFDNAGDGDCSTKITSGVTNTINMASTTNNVAISDNGYSGCLSSMASSPITIPPGTIPATAMNVVIEVDMNISHNWVGQLTMKLQDPNGNILGLVSEPGTFAADTDDGLSFIGDASNLDGNTPAITFKDGATNAELMGFGLGGGATICADGGPCDFDPVFNNTNPGAPCGVDYPTHFSFTSLVASYADPSEANGTWTLYVGDAIPGAVGTLDAWNIRIIFDGALYHPTISDNCPLGSGTLQVQYNNPTDAIHDNNVLMDVTSDAGTLNDHDFYAGVTTVTYTATDDNGLTTICDFTVAIADDEDPTWDVLQTVAPPTGSMVTTGNGTTTNAFVNAITGYGFMDIEIECQDPNYTNAWNYWNTYTPSASDNCATAVTVTPDGTNFNIDGVDGCETINGHNNSKRRFNRRFKATDGTNSIGLATANQFAVRIFVVDNIGPDYSAFDNTLGGSATASGPVTEPTTDNFDGGTLTLNVGDFYDVSSPMAPCGINMGQINGTDPSQPAQIVTTPSLLAMATECTEGINTFGDAGGIDYTGWTISCTGPCPVPPFVSGHGNTGTDDNNADQFYPVGSYDIVYNAIDKCGNMSTFSFTLEIVDNIAPLFSACPMTANYTGANATSADPGLCQATVQFPNNLATASDNCGGLVTLTASGVHNSTGDIVPIDLMVGPGLADGDFSIGTTTVTYTFSDGTNTSDCSFDVQVTDNQAPTITNCSDQFFASVCPGAIFDFTAHGVPSDNCPGYTVTQVPPAGPLSGIPIPILTDVLPLGPSDGDQISVKLVVSDGTGTGMCTFTVTLQDNDEPIPDELPSLTNISTLNTVEAGCGSIVVDAPTAKDCNGVIIPGIPSTADGVAGTDQYLYTTGFHFVVWTYDDGNGNSKTQTQTILIDDDNIAPSLACPGTKVVSTDPNLCTATGITGIGMSSVGPGPAPYNPSQILASGTGVDNCGIVKWEYEINNNGTKILGSNAGGQTFDKGNTTVTYYATDGASPSGNESSCSFTVTVNDTQKPRPNLSNYVLLTGDDTAPIVDADADDCSFTVSGTVLDPLPTDNCPGTPSKLIINITEPTNGTYTPGPSTSSLAGAIFEVDDATGSGTFIVRWRFSDGTNIRNRNQTITVRDGEPPTFVCLGQTAATTNSHSVTKGAQSDGTYDCDYTIQGAEFDISNVMDNCDIDFYENDWNNGTTLAGEDLPVGTHTIEWVAYDHFGNSTTCEINITVEDDGEPQFNCVDIIRPLPSVGFLTVDEDDFILFGSITDNCPAGPITFTVTPNTFVCENATNTPIAVQIVGKDPAGNIATCTPSITIQESFAPTVLCDNITKSLAGPMVTISASELNNGSFDNCATNTPALNYWFDAAGTEASITYDCSQITTHSVNIYAQDPAGNISAPCAATITIEDTTPPTALCQALTLPLDDTGNLTVDADEFDNGSSDNCGPLTYTVNGGNLALNFTCAQIGSGAIPIVLEVSDGINPTETCNTTITILDETGPDADCQDRTVNLDATGSLAIMASMFDLASADVCSGTSLNFAFAGGGPGRTVDCNDIGTHPVTINVQDQNGNITQCTPNLTVLPNQVVEFTASDECGASGTNLTIEITVDNFFEMRSFQFPGNIDPAIATIVSIQKAPGVPGTFAQSFTTATGDFFVAWSYSASLPAPQAVNLSDGSVAFTITVNLVASVFGDMSIVDLDDTQPAPNNLEVAQGCAPLPAVTSGEVNDGSVEVCSSNATLSGFITTEEGTPVQFVNVVAATDANGTNVVDSDITDATGYYEVTVLSGTEIWIIPTKDINHKNGPSALDAAIVQAASAGLPVLLSGHKRISADANGSNNVTALDAAIIQFVVVTLNATFHAIPVPPNPPAYDSDSWVFVDANHVFTVPTNPWNAPYNDHLYYSSATSMSNQNLIGNKVGDVNASGDPINMLNGSGDTRTEETLYLQIKDQTIKAGETYNIPVTAKDFKDMLAFQLTLEFDTDVLEYIDFETGKLSSLNRDVIGLQNVKDGWIGMAWFNETSIDIRDEEVLFTLTFKAKENADHLRDLIYAGATISEPTAYQSDQLARGLEFNFKDIEVSEIPVKEFMLYQNQPNPFKGNTLIGFNLPEANIGTFSIVDISGKLVHSQKGDFSQGYNEIIIDRSDLPTSGVFFYQLNTPTHTAVKKMTLIE